MLHSVCFEGWGMGWDVQGARSSPAATPALRTHRSSLAGPSRSHRRRGARRGREDAAHAAARGAAAQTRRAPAVDGCCSRECHAAVGDQSCGGRVGEGRDGEIWSMHVDASCMWWQGVGKIQARVVAPGTAPDAIPCCALPMTCHACCIQLPTPRRYGLFDQLLPASAGLPLQVVAVEADHALLQVSGRSSGAGRRHGGIGVVCLLASWIRRRRHGPACTVLVSSPVTRIHGMDSWPPVSHPSSAPHPCCCCCTATLCVGSTGAPGVCAAHGPAVAVGHRVRWAWAWQP